MNGHAMGQFLRYAVIGLVSNAVLYVGYLVLTQMGLGSKLAMTMMYAVGVAQTFFFNKRWTFAHSGRSSQVFSRYVLLYATGYALNMLVLGLCVDQLGWSHQWVMLALMLMMVIFFFVGQKFWVFRTTLTVNSNERLP